MRYFLLLFSWAFTLNSLAQKHDNIWLIGGSDPSAKIEFNASSLMIDTVIKGGMRGARAFTSIGDSLGNLLFYTNGIWVNNAQHQIMQNGDSLNPGQMADDFRNVGYPTCNSVIILPHPVHVNKYYIFHQSIDNSSQIAGFAEKLYYSLVDMNANGGSGRVEIKNQILVSDSLSMGQVHAVKHANGRDWWLIQGKGHSIGFYTFLIAENQITLEHEQYIGDTSRLGNGAEWTGQCVFSPQGDKYARYDYLNDLDIYDFDRCTGLLSNNVHIAIQDSADINAGVTGGTAISPSGQYLYVSSFLNLYQFDLWAININSTKDTVGRTDNFYQFFPNNRAFFNFLQLGPDNKIYGVAPNTSYLHVIENPDLGGSSCNVLQHHINTNFINGFFTPNHPHYRMPASIGSPCDTLTSIIDVGNKKINNVLLYPNPNNGIVTIESESIIQDVIIYDALGKEVIGELNIEKFIVSLDTKVLENGAYIVSIKLVNGRIINKKMIVQRE